MRPVLNAIFLWDLFASYTTTQSVINKFFIKLFITTNIHVVSDCQEQFRFMFNSPVA